MSLTDRKKKQRKALIDAGQPLPPRSKAVLFDQPHEAELIWPGKTHEVTNVVLPFQSIEQIDEPRAGAQAGATDLFALDPGIACYYPDFIVRRIEAEIRIVETKGREDLDDPLKWGRLKVCCPVASTQDEAGRKYHALFVQQEDWEAHKLTSFGQLATACG